MARWLTYIKERFPLPTYLLLVGGFVFSGTCLGPWLGGQSVSWGWDLLFKSIGLLLFFAELRLMDEYKDYQKDLVAHPNRPLPRGLLKLDEVSNAIKAILISMLVLALVLASPIYGLITIYLWLMYKEFFIGKWLEPRPLLYAISHQVIILPIVFFSATGDSPQLNAQTGYLGLAILGAFFSYEVARKLDPNAHPILKTYLATFGPWRTIALLILLNSVAALGAFGMGAQNVLVPVELAVVSTALLVAFKPQLYKNTEAFATLSLLVHLWAIPALYFFGVSHA